MGSPLFAPLTRGAGESVQETILSSRGRPELLSLIESPYWQTLDEIRQTLVSALVPDFSNLSEHEQLSMLEALLGTEEGTPDPVMLDENGRPLVACVWDNLDSPDPEPVYKIVGEYWTEDDTSRVIADQETRMADLKAMLRVLNTGKETDETR